MKLFCYLGLLFTFSSCQINYYLKSGYNQVKILNARVPLEKALKNPTLSEEEHHKLQLALEVRDFAEHKLHLTTNKTFTTYSKLDRPYVTWVLSAAPRWELKAYKWSYLFVGDLPYRGYYTEAEALEEQQEMDKEYDTYVRGVSAYSTLGYFNDPILSSMIKYEDTTFVDTLIHELVHATVFIKDNADFNERLAVFLGAKGMQMFYLEKEGEKSESLKSAKDEHDDDMQFSKFIVKEIADLKSWYGSLAPENRNEEVRKKKLAEIGERFGKEVLPQMKTKNWEKFPTIKLNNARLMTYATYMSDLSDFEKLYAQVGESFDAFLDKIRTLEKSKDPEVDLKKLVQSSK